MIRWLLFGNAVSERRIVNIVDIRWPRWSWRCLEKKEIEASPSGGAETDWDDPISSAQDCEKCAQQESAAKESREGDAILCLAPCSKRSDRSRGRPDTQLFAIGAVGIPETLVREMRRVRERLLSKPLVTRAADAIEGGTLRETLRGDDGTERSAARVAYAFTFVLNCAGAGGSSCPGDH